MNPLTSQDVFTDSPGWYQFQALRLSAFLAAFGYSTTRCESNSFGSPGRTKQFVVVPRVIKGCPAGIGLIQPRRERRCLVVGPFAHLDSSHNVLPVQTANLQLFFISNMYLLPCPSCQAPITVSPSQAGDTQVCPSCGETAAIPKLGDLRELPRADGKEHGRNPEI